MCSHKSATLRVKWTRAPLKTRSCRWIHHWTVSGGKVWLAIGRETDGYILRFRTFADFHWSPRQRVLTCHVRPRTEMRTVRHLLLDQVLPVISSAEHVSGLHASAVLVGDEAVAFAGKTGRGKSTLAASFAAVGFPAMTDDCLIVKEGARTVPRRTRVCLSEIVGRCGERSRWKPRPSTSGHLLLSEDTIQRVDVQDAFSRSSSPASLCVPAREASCDPWRPDRTVVRTRRVHGAGSSFLPTRPLRSRSPRQRDGPPCAAKSDRIGSTPACPRRLKPLVGTGRGAR